MTLWIVGMLSITDEFAIISASEYSALYLRKYFLATLCLFVGNNTHDDTVVYGTKVKK